MTVPPLKPAEITELRDILDRNDDQYHCVVENGILESLIYRAEDHARLHAAFGEECIRAGLLAEELDGCDAEHGALRAENAQLDSRVRSLEMLPAKLAEATAERDALRAEVATLKAENAQYAENLGDIVTYGTTADRLDQQLQVIVAERDTLKARISLLEAVVRFVPMIHQHPPAPVCLVCDAVAALAALEETP